MRSSSNFLPALNHQSPLNNNIQHANNMMISPHGHNHETNIKLENRVFYVEKATARLIHAFESVGHRLTKIESDNNNNNINIAALSKTIHVVKDSNKEFISKQHITTDRLVTDMQKLTHKLSQQTGFINKEISDVRDSMQMLSTNLQNNFNESIKSAMKQCNDFNMQNSNCITSLRKITDQKVSHLQELIVDSQKRAQSQNASILDIINSNQKNQSEFQRCFKSFFEKFRDSMHQNLSALQESSQEQISYLDNVLRAEVKTRIKNSQNMNKETDDKISQVQQDLNQNKRDNKRSFECIMKNVESVKEIQKHQENANQPFHQIITNLSKQFDESSQQHLTDIKSMMQLNQDTSEKQFNQIKSLQIQIQQMWTKISNQQESSVTISSTNDERYMIRPQSYKSDMSSTAAFNAIKHHLAHMPSKPTDTSIYSNDNEYIQHTMEDNGIVDVDDNGHIESAKSEFQQLSMYTSPRERKPEILSVSEIKTETEIKVVENDETANDVEYDDEYQNDEENIENIESTDNNENIEIKESDDVNQDEDVEKKDICESRNNEDIIEKSGEHENDDYEDDIDNMFDGNDENNDVANDSVIDNYANVEASDPIEQHEEQHNEYDDANDMEDIDDILGDESKDGKENTSDNNTEPQENDNYSQEYAEDDNVDDNNNAEEQKIENEEIAKTESITNYNNDISSETEKMFETEEAEQNETNDNVSINNADSNDNDQYSEF